MAWKKALLYAAHRLGTQRSSDTITTRILRKVKEHHSMISDLPPKEQPPCPYVVMKRATIYGGPVVKRSFKDEEISISVVRTGDVMRGEPDHMKEIFVHIDISKAGQQESLHFLCGLYNDGFGIHSCSLRPKADTSPFLKVSKNFRHDEKIQDALHRYVVARGINSSLFKYLQIWLRYEKDQIKLKRWLRILHTFVKKNAQGTILMEDFASFKPY